MKNDSMHFGRQPHMPHVDKTHSVLISKLTEVVNGSMRLFHEALELHWNYQGPNFIAIHHFLDAHYKTLLTHFDELAERAVTMGGVMKLIPAMHAHEPAAHPFSIDHYLTEAEQFCERLKDAVQVSEEDAVTNDLLVRYLGVLEKDLWQLRSTLGQAVDTANLGPQPGEMVQ